MSQASTNLNAFAFEAIFALLLMGVQSNIIVLPDVLYNLSTTAPADNYVMQNQRQYTASDRLLEMHLANFRNDYYGRVDTIDYHLDLLEMKLNEVDNKLNPLVLLDEVNDYCVRKYRSKLPILDTIKTSLATCKQNAKAACEPLISSAESTRRNLKNYYANQFANQLKDCKKKFADLEGNYTTCTTAAITSTNSVTTSNLNQFHNQLKLAKCSAVIKIKETFDCYATVVGNTYSSVGEVMGLVENCMAGREFCPSCGGTDTIPSGRCPYHLSWHLSESDMTSEKINNPFKGVSKSTPCLQINFITKGVPLS